MVACPSSSCTTFACSPFDSRMVAHVWRRSWNLICGSPAFVSSGLKERCVRLWRFRGVPIYVANTRPFSRHREPARSIFSPS